MLTSQKTLWQFPGPVLSFRYGTGWKADDRPK